MISAMFKVLSQQLRGTLTTTFERHLQLKILLKWINTRVNSLLGQNHEAKMGEGEW